MRISDKYMYIPIKKGETEECIEFYLNRGGFLIKIMEFKIPVANHELSADEIDYWAEIPVGQWYGDKLHIEGKNAEYLEKSIQFDKKRNALQINHKCKERRAKFHYSPNVGWCNDPNGLLYIDGEYHFFYQYNPMNISWENMCWGHAKSKDLINWEEMDTTLLPDEDGTMFSGCGVVNEQKLLGLPEKAMVFFYTAAGDNNKWSAGKEFTQKIAYSVDGGKKLLKIQTPCIDVIERDSRDPKVFWHEDTKAYIMTLWIKDDVFAIFRSNDFRNWEETDRFSLKDGWECPDLFKIRTEYGQEAWVFWSASGVYYVGSFDGYKFVHDGIRRDAYIGKNPYAAQAFYGLGDRVLSIPWLRIENDGSNYTGYYGFPTDFSGSKKDGQIVLKQTIAREIIARTVSQEEFLKCDDSKKAQAAVIISGELEKEAGEIKDFNFRINGTEISYFAQKCCLKIGDSELDIKLTKGKIILCIDADLLEVYLEDGERYGAYRVKTKEFSFESAEAESCRFERRFLI